MLTVPLVGIEIAPLDWGVAGLWWGYAVGAIASFALGLAWFLRGSWTEGVIEDAASLDAPSVDGGSVTDHGERDTPATED